MVEHGQALSIKFSFPSFPRPRSRADRYSAEINTRGEEELSVVACSDGERIYVRGEVGSGVNIHVTLSRGTYIRLSSSLLLSRYS